jgi:phosphate:Na+ symporter
LFALVAFHSLFNIVGIFLFLPFLDLFISFLRYLVPDVHYKGELGVHIERVPPTVAEAAIEAVRKELQNFIIHSIILNLRCFKINPHNVFPPELTDYLGQHNRYEDDYAMLKRASGEILGYTYSVQGYSQDEAAIRQLTRLNHAIRNISYAAKFTKDIRHNLAEFRHSESDYIQKTHTELNIWFNQVNQKLLKLLLNRNPELFNDDSDSIKSEFRKTYEEILQKIYTASGENLIDDEQTTSLLNVNRAIYLSTNALLEALGVLYKGIDITETALISEPAP